MRRGDRRAGGGHLGAAAGAAGGKALAVRLLAAELGISNVKVAGVRRERGPRPWRAGSFKFSTDPALEARVRDVAGLYLNPPDKAVVLLTFPRQVATAYPRVPPHIVADDYGTRKYPSVQAWLARHPRITLPSAGPRGRRPCQEAALTAPPGERRPGREPP